MDKHRPHYSLSEIQIKVAELEALAFTLTARQGIREMGLTLRQATAAIMQLNSSCFYKSMTTRADHRIWQDVYHVPTSAGLAYAKFTLRDDGALVISFKRL